MKFLKNQIGLLFLIGLISELFYVTFLVLNAERDIPLYMFVYFESFVLFFFAYFLIQNKRPNDEHNSKIVFLIVGFGILFRMTLIPTSYTTSDDVHRYLWEGKVIVNGFNPYTTPPNDSSLVHLRDDNFEKVTFKNMPAIYPPLSKVVFTLNYLVTGNNPVFLKIIYLIFDVITLIFLIKLLKLRGKNPKLILLYSWLPLPILEYFNNSHIDVIGITFLVLFIYYFEKEKYNLSAVMLAFAFLSKLIALLALPLVIKKLGFKKSLVFYTVFLFVSIIFYLPFLSGNVDVLAGLLKYLSRWEFNGSVYNLFKIIFSSGQTARIICAVLLSFSVLTIAFLYKNFIKAVFAVLLCLIIFSTTVYPWYLGWIAAINVLNPFYSVLSLFFTINFSNFTPLAPVWKEYPIVWIIQYVPFYGLMVYDWWRLMEQRLRQRHVSLWLIK